MSEKQQYINFDEYIRQGEPAQREAAYAWSTAIGLQAVDGLKTSEYLNQLAQRNIEGEITIDEVEQLLNSYYESKTTHEADEEGKKEADEVNSLYEKMEEAVKIWNNDFDLEYWIHTELKAYLGICSGSRMMRDYLNYLF